jgi:hypothetical protein
LKLKIIHPETRTSVSGNILRVGETFEVNDFEGSELLRRFPDRYEEVLPDKTKKKDGE